MVSKTLFSSAKQDYETPDDLFAWAHERWGFTIDACAVLANAKLPRYWNPRQDGLTQPWHQKGIGLHVWCNPPYNQLKHWVEKAYNEAIDNDALSVLLIPARTDTKIWHSYVFNHASEVYFIKGRLRFKGAPSSAPFPSALVVYGSGADQTVYGQLIKTPEGLWRVA